MLFRRTVGLILLLLTVLAYWTLAVETAPDFVSNFYMFAGLWAHWALVVLFLVRRELPLGAGRFVLRMLGIDR